MVRRYGDKSKVEAVFRCNSVDIRGDVVLRQGAAQLRWKYLQLCRGWDRIEVPGYAAAAAAHCSIARSFEISVLRFMRRRPAARLLFPLAFSSA